MRVLYAHRSVRSLVYTVHASWGVIGVPVSGICSVWHTCICSLYTYFVAGVLSVVARTDCVCADVRCACVWVW
jgi:hypothetical protein